MIFLAATSRCEHTLLVLESRNMKITTKYRSVETLDGTPANTSPPAVPKKINPARARSKLQLDKFIRKKTDQKKTDQLESRKTAPAAGDPCSTSSWSMDRLHQGSTAQYPSWMGLLLVSISNTLSRLNMERKTFCIP
jgi:hypothetical protein